MPDLPIPPATRDELVFLNWYVSRFNSWGYGGQPDSDPRRAGDFAAHVVALGKDPSDLSAFGFPVHAIPPQPPLAPMGETPAPEPVSALSDFRALQVWQQFEPAKVAAFCVEAGLNTVLVKVLDGDWWMGDRYAGNPDSPEAVAAQRDFFHSLGLRYGVWTNPLFGDDTFLDQQARQTALAAQNADFVALDTEPYADFWGANRPAGKARQFMQWLVSYAPDAVLIWQPDPRPERLAELRPEEWAPFMDALAGQHYFTDFLTTPEHEAGAAVARRNEWVPAGALLPTFSMNGASPPTMRRATESARANGAAGFILWRYGVPNDLELARAAVAGWG